MRHFHRVMVILVCFLLLTVIAGCVSAPWATNPEESSADPVNISSPGERGDGYEDPEKDVVGWEGGVWHDEPIDVDQSDGLSDDELDTLTNRSMARVEAIRGEEFEKPVDTTVMSREEYQDNNPFESSSASTHNDWNNQIWEALFLVGESDDISKEFDTLTGSSVLGYYAPSSGELVIVSESASNPTVDPNTLVHELTHALQDQRFDLAREEMQPRVQDAQLAKNGLVEGEAKYIEDRYRELCGGEWECVDNPTSSGTSSGGNLGVQVLNYQPYSDGPAYISHLVDEKGWSAVDDAFESPPTRTAETIHPDWNADSEGIGAFPEERNGWSKFRGVGDDGADSVGEASVFVMLWYQNRAHSIDTIPVSSINSNDGTEYSYEHEKSHGLVDDRIVPYKNGDERGYIWRMNWESADDAAKFVDAYETILSGHGGNEVSESLWVIEEGEFADAFYVEQDGRNVTIANAPNEATLNQLLPGAGDGGEVSTEEPSSERDSSINTMAVTGVAGVFVAAMGLALLGKGA